MNILAIDTSSRFLCIGISKGSKIVVDFDGVKFFSSQMLGLLVDVWRRVKEYDGTMLISGINSQLSRVFKITNLDRIFKFCPDKAAAMKTLKQCQ